MPAPIAPAPSSVGQRQPAGGRARQPQRGSQRRLRCDSAQIAWRVTPATGERSSSSTRSASATSAGRWATRTTRAASHQPPQRLEHLAARSRRRGWRWARRAAAAARRAGTLAPARRAGARRPRARRRDRRGPCRAHRAASRPRRAGRLPRARSQISAVVASGRPRAMFSAIDVANRCGRWGIHDDPRAPGVGVEVGQLDLADPHRPALRRDEAEQHRQQRRFAASAGAGDGEDLPGLEDQREAIDRRPRRGPGYSTRSSSTVETGERRVRRLGARARGPAAASRAPRTPAERRSCPPRWRGSSRPAAAAAGRPRERARARTARCADPRWPPISRRPISTATSATEIVATSSRISEDRKVTRSVEIVAWR